MFGLPIARAFRSAPPSSTALPALRIAFPAPRYSPIHTSRTISSSSLTYRTLAFSRTLPRLSGRFPSRPFSSSARQGYGYRNDRYRRFGGSAREPLFIRMLQNAQPKHFVIIGVVIGGFYIYNTETVEMTGRRRFNCIPAHQELKMGQKSYQDVLSDVRGRILPENHPITMKVNKVLARLIPQAPIEGANWKVHVIKDDGMVNAFVLPGGKVFVYTGILPICEDEDGLAAVLGHEIAHVVAHHPAERMSNNIVTIGAVFLVSMLFDISGHIPSMLFNLMYSLPNSRTQEAEADDIGLMMMSRACYNPEAAVKL
ncbi:hypothetical protein AWENTII_004461 [Aspergillus wentii]